MPERGCKLHELMAATCGGPSKDIPYDAAVRIRPRSANLAACGSTECCGRLATVGSVVAWGSDASADDRLLPSADTFLEVHTAQQPSISVAAAPNNARPPAVATS